MRLCVWRTLDRRSAACAGCKNAQAKKKSQKILDMSHLVAVGLRYTGWIEVNHAVWTEVKLAVKCRLALPPRLECNLRSTRTIVTPKTSISKWSGRKKTQTATGCSAKARNHAPIDKGRNQKVPPKPPVEVRLVSCPNQAKHRQPRPA